MALNPSNSPISLKIVVDQTSLDRLGKGLDKTIDREAGRLAIKLARRGAGILRQLDDGAGRKMLAQGWTTSAPIETATAVSVDVFNSLEDVTIETRSNAPRSKRTFPIKGSTLIGILNYGARTHLIISREQKTPLQFPIRAGFRESKFAGTARTSAGYGVGRYKSAQFDDVGVFFEVAHPGVTGSRFLQAARMALLNAVTPLVAEFGRNVNVGTSEV